jgi:pSer/pThr/pTyr-binding forkhead associated (FHA) protein
MTLASRRADGVVSADVSPFPDAGVASSRLRRVRLLDRRAERMYMPVIKVNNQQYPLHPGQNRLGAGTDADVLVAADDSLGIQAIVEVADDSQVVIRRAGNGASVRVNGIALIDPTPLMHGDKVEIAGSELLYSDDSKSGNTAFVSAADFASFVQKRSGPARATTATGGRLVSLVDGKEYTVSDAGLTIGRDASADVVVAQNEVSRKHAEIAPIEDGYEVRDFSANGVYVNGVRVDKKQLLARADVIRVGSEEFRFYADVRAAAPAPAASVPQLEVTMIGTPAVSAPAVPPRAPAAPSVAPPAPPVAVAPPPAPRAAPPVETPAPVAVKNDGRPVLALLEITNPGPTKGQKFEIHVPLAHVGRGSHNDIVLADDSVSETHAKLQKRDDGWYVVDVGSTNGTYVGGQRLSAERKLEGAPDVRFGGVKMIFRAKDLPGETAAGGTRAIASIDRSKLRQTTPATQHIPAPVAESAPEAGNTPARQGLPGWVWGVVVLAVVAAVAFFLLNR